MLKNMLGSGKPVINETSNKSLSDYINDAIGIHDIDEYIEFIMNCDCSVFAPLTILVMANISLDATNKLLKKLDIKYISDDKYVNFFELVEIKAFDHIYEILSFLKKNNNSKLDEVLFKVHKKVGAFIMFLFVMVPNNYVKRLWNIVKDTHLTYEDKISQKNLLMILVLTYHQNSDKHLFGELFEVVKEYIEIVPKFLYRPRHLPIMNKLMVFESRLDMSYSEEEYAKIKYKDDLDDHNIKLIKHIIKSDPDVVNVTDSYGQHSLMYAALGNHIGLFDFLMDNSANINTTIVTSKTSHTLIYVIKTGTIELQEHIIKYIDQIDFSFVDHNLESFASYAAGTINDLSMELFKKIIEWSDNLEKSNIFGNTILHILARNIYRFKEVEDILLNKKLDFSKVNTYGRQFIDYVNKDDIRVLYDFMLRYYDKHNTNSSKLDADVIIDKLLSKKRVDKKNDAIIVKYSHADYSIFNNSWYNILIQMYNITKKYDEYGFPFYNYDDIDLHKLIKCNRTKCKKNEICTDKLTHELCKYYVNATKKVEKYPSVYLQLNHLWYDKNSYIIPHKLYEALEYVHKETEQYIFGFMLTINEENLNHANALIIDMNKKIAIRFETYGNYKDNTIYNNSDIDNAYEKYLQSHDKSFKYIRPRDYLPTISFQSVSQTDVYDYVKMGDPEGFCAAWTVWFIETYIIHNKRIKDKKDLKILCENLFNKILTTHGSIIDYIRNYGNNLAEEEAKVVHDEIGINPERKYIKYYSKEDLSYIFEYINKNIEDQFI